MASQLGCGIPGIAIGVCPLHWSMPSLLGCVIVVGVCHHSKTVASQVVGMPSNEHLECGIIANILFVRMFTNTVFMNILMKNTSDCQKFFDCWSLLTKFV